MRQQISKDKMRQQTRIQRSISLVPGIPCILCSASPIVMTIHPWMHACTALWPISQCSRVMHIWDVPCHAPAWHGMASDGSDRQMISSSTWFLPLGLVGPFHSSLRLYRSTYRKRLDKLNNRSSLDSSATDNSVASSISGS